MQKETWRKRKSEKTKKREKYMIRNRAYKNRERRNIEEIQGKVEKERQNEDMKE